MKNPQIRYPFFDSVRGFALIIMAIYHFSFDLNQFQVIHQNMNYDDFWLNFRALIMTLFLGLVGVSFQFAQTEFSNPGFQSRLKKVAICALSISIVTYVMNSQTWIYFGVLHFIVIASLLGPWLVRIPKTALAVGVGLILVPLFYRSLMFNGPILNLTGLSPVKPITEDFSPLLPWLGVVMIGVFLGYLTKKFNPQFAQNREIPVLSKLGRRSLLFYMTHQLVLLPIAWLSSQIFSAI
jgi:uncharacterized membrane protein